MAGVAAAGVLSGSAVAVVRMGAPRSLRAQQRGVAAHAGETALVARPAHAGIRREARSHFSRRVGTVLPDRGCTQPRTAGELAMAGGCPWPLGSIPAAALQMGNEFRSRCAPGT